VGGSKGIHHARENELAIKASRFLTILNKSGKASSQLDAQRKSH